MSLILIYTYNKILRNRENNCVVFWINEYTFIIFLIYNFSKYVIYA